MNKRVLLVFSLLVLIFTISLASAAYFPDARSLSQSVVDGYVSVGEPILQALFGGYGGWSGFLLFERFLLFILLLAIIYVVLGRISFFEHQKYVKWVIAIVIPLIGIRYMNYELIEAILIQYKLLSVILSSLLPLVIFFFFIHNIGGDYPILRKVGWLAFIGIYIGLWSTTSGDFQSSIFFWTVVAAVALLIFDRRIELYFTAREYAKRERINIGNKIAELNDKINKLHTQLMTGSHPFPAQVRREISELQLQKKYLTRQF